MVGRTLPDVEEPLYAPFWAAARERRLVVRECQECGRMQWPPRLACTFCRSDRIGYTSVPGTGSLYSWTVVQRSFVPGFVPPYVVAVVALDVDARVRLLGNLAGPDGAAVPDLVIGQPVVVRYDEVDGVTLPNWQLAVAGA